VDLDRKTLAGEEIFDEQLARHAGGVVIPDFAHGRLAGRLIGEQGRQIVPPPGLFDAMDGERRRRQCDSPVSCPQS
jgi:hypothetical protein